MNPNKLNINNNVSTDFDALDKDINDIESILQETYKEMLKLDETVWKAKEKEKIDQTFVPYLKRFTESYPSYLRVRLQFARDSVQSHYELDQENAKLEDIVG